MRWKEEVGKEGWFGGEGDIFIFIGKDLVGFVCKWISSVDEWGIADVIVLVFCCLWIFVKNYGMMLSLVN